MTPLLPGRRGDAREPEGGFDFRTLGYYASSVVVYVGCVLDDSEDFGFFGFSALLVSY